MEKKRDGAKTTVLDQNLLKTTYSDGCIINAALLENIRSEYTRISGNKNLDQLKLMLVFEGGIQVSRDVGQRYLVERIRPKIGEALVASNPQTAEYLKAATAVMTSSPPVQFFENEDYAKNWLLSL